MKKIMGSLNEELKKRTKNQAVGLIKLLMTLPFNDALSVMRKQLIRSSTSVASNYRAACRSRSQKERYSKICTVVEEADECMFWMELLEETGYLTREQLENFLNEGEEILKVMATYKNKIKP